MPHRGAEVSADAHAIPSRLVLVGHPVSHSLSPAFQNAALEALALPLRYDAVDVPPDHLAAALAAFARDGVAGNVTIPHKVAVAQVARCTPLAQRVGAVNTFWHTQGVLHGDNTDVVGVMAALQRLHPEATWPACRCVVLGAGGSAAAVLVALDQLGCREIRVAAREIARASALLQRVGVVGSVVAFTAASLAEAVGEAAVVINATSIGLTDETEPVPISALAPGAVVLDLVYRPGETAWVRRARAAGHPAADGRTMLLEQGAAAFAVWFQRPAPYAVMQAALDRACAQALVPITEPTVADGG